MIMKKDIFKFIILLGFISASSVLMAKDMRQGNAIWFNEMPDTQVEAPWTVNDFSSTIVNPDTVWENYSLPIGNGSFGGNIIGSVGKERIVLNEKTLWHGGPATGTDIYREMNRKVSPEIMTRIRDLVVADSLEKAEKLIQDNFRGNIDYTRDRFGAYSVLGEVYISTDIDENKVSDYHKILNLDNSLALIEFDYNGSKYQREYFASYPDSVIVCRFTSDNEPMNITFEVNIPHPVQEIKTGNSSVVYTGSLSDNNLQWALGVTARSNDANADIDFNDNGTITVNNATDIEFILAADTDYRMNFDPDFTDPKTYTGEDVEANVSKILAMANNLSHEELYSRHRQDYKNLYDRVTFTLNPEAQNTEAHLIPTDKRLKNYKAGTTDNGLEEIYYQFGRYLLISSSREGSMPANLQGMWHNNIDGPWRVDYHNNINIQMNYWPATNANLAECFIPLADYVRSLVKPGRQTAKDYYNARGWTTGISSNIFGFTAPLNSEQMFWNYIPTAGPWLAAQLWEYYDYTRDKDWLRETGYTIISESADFATDILYKHGDYYTSNPSYSPEHGNVDLGATFANAVTMEILKDAIAAARILDIDSARVVEWQEKLDNMAPYKVGRFGQLQEWWNDIDDPDDDHRHFNHLYGIHPGTTINTISDSALVQAAKTTLTHRGDVSTGWSMAWKINQWARLFDGDKAYTLFQELLKNGTAPNLWDLHPPFQIDGNLGATAGITELFLQSHNGVIHLLPALPKAWENVTITGIRARGNFTIDLNVKKGELESATVHSGSGEMAEIFYNGDTIKFPTIAGKGYRLNFSADIPDQLIVSEL